MIQLPITFRAEGFEFKQLAREGNVALFRKTKFLKRANPPPEFETFEAAIIQQEGEHQWPNGIISPAHERMPSSETWGTYGWSLQDSGRAREKFREIVLAQSVAA